MNTAIRHAGLIGLSLVCVASCRPPAADDYAARMDGQTEPAANASAAQAESPDISNAIWAISGKGTRLLYGAPGERPLLVLSCEGDKTAPMLRVLRRAPADPHAKALLALIGNGHAERLPINARWNGRDWIWEGIYAASDPRLEVFSGPREVEVTLPGGGSLVLEPSPLPRALIESCAGINAPDLPDPPASQS